MISILLKILLAVHFEYRRCYFSFFCLCIVILNWIVIVYTVIFIRISLSLHWLHHKFPSGAFADEIKIIVIFSPFRVCYKCTESQVASALFF